MNDLMKTERTKNEELINDSIQEVKKKVFENLSLENQVFFNLILFNKSNYIVLKKREKT